MSKVRASGLIAGPVVLGVILSGLAGGTAEATADGATTVTADTESNLGVLVRSYPSTGYSQVGGIGEGERVGAYCSVVGESVEGHVRATDRWVFVGDGWDGFVSAGFLRGAEAVPPCLQDGADRASRFADRRIPVPPWIVDRVKRALYEGRHRKPETPRKPDSDLPDTPPDQAEVTEGASLRVGDFGQLRSANYSDFVLGADADGRAALSSHSNEQTKIEVQPGFEGEGSVALHLPALGQYLRHVNGQLVASPYVDDALWRQDASFYAKPAQDGRGAPAVSLESVNYPGHFVRHFDSQFELGTPDTRPGTPFPADATFHWLVY